MQPVVAEALKDIRCCNRNPCCIQNAIEKARLKGVKLARLAVVLEEEIKETHGWTIADARVVKDVFASYNIAFTILLKEVISPVVT